MNPPSIKPFPGRMGPRPGGLAAILTLLLLAAGCTAVAPGAGSDGPAQPQGQAEPETEAPARAGPLVVYSGRSEDLVAPILDRFQEVGGTQILVRYGDTAEMAATLLEEGANSPAAVYYAQDAGALGAVSRAGLFQPLPADILERAPAHLRSSEGTWVGLSARVRVVAYNRRLVSPAELPDSVWELTAPQWRGQVGWAPTNGSFQAFVTALRILWGEEKTAQWLRGMVANEPQVYSGNTPIRDAVASGEIKLGLINHYYVARAYASEGPEYPVGLHYPPNDPGSLINVAGAGVLATAGAQREPAVELLGFLLSEEAQTYFSEQTREYPIVAGVEPHPALVPLAEIPAPPIDLNDLSDLEGTLRLLEETGVL